MNALRLGEESDANAGQQKQEEVSCAFCDNVLRLAMNRMFPQKTELAFCGSAALSRRHLTIYAKQYLGVVVGDYFNESKVNVEQRSKSSIFRIVRSMDIQYAACVLATIFILIQDKTLQTLSNRRFFFVQQAVQNCTNTWKGYHHSIGTSYVNQSRRRALSHDDTEISPFFTVNACRFNFQVLMPDQALNVEIRVSLEIKQRSGAKRATEAGLSRQPKH